MAKPRISRPKIQKQIIPQHEIERGDDELAFLLKLRQEDSSVEEITHAYHIADYKCPCISIDDRFCYLCTLPSADYTFSSYKEAFTHFRNVHYTPTMSLDRDDPATVETFKEIAGRSHYTQEVHKKSLELKAAQANLRRYENSNFYGYDNSSPHWIVQRFRNEVSDLKDQYDRLRYNDMIKYRYINEKASDILEGLDTQKERYNRIYSMFQHFVIIEAAGSLRGRHRTRGTEDRRKRKYTAYYGLCKEFLFTDQQLAMLFDKSVYDMRKYLAAGLDLYYGGTENYPAWMQRVLTKKEEGDKEIEI
jgi:hypothetical protein